MKKIIIGLLVASLAIPLLVSATKAARPTKPVVSCAVGVCTLDSNSTDAAGRVTGSGLVYTDSVNVTFSSSKSTVPFCVVSDDGYKGFSAVITNISKTGFTVTGFDSFYASTFTYICL